jgi:hypothetical protein
MDSQADQPSGGGADPPGGSQSGGDHPWGATPPPDSGQQWGGPPQPGGDQPWGGTPPPESGQPWGGTPQPGGDQYPGQPPIIAGTGTGPSRIRPGRIWYLVPVLLILGGIASVVFGFVSLSSTVDSFARVPLPAGGTITLNHSGGYVVYYEGPGASSGQIPRFNVRIAPAAAIGSLRTYAGTVNYTIGTRQGRAVLTLQVVHPGKFLVEASGAGAAPVGSDLAFGQSLGGAIVGIVLPTIGLIFLGVASWILLFVIRLTRTRRARAQGY